MRQFARLAILLMAVIASTLIAAPRSFLPLEVTQPDGSRINIYASGDEFHNWLHDENDFTIVRDANGAYVYAIQENGGLVPSDLVVGKHLPSARNLTPGLNLSPAEIKARYDCQSQMRDYSNGRAPNTGQINNIVIFIKFSDSPEFNTYFSYYQQVFNASGATDNSMKNYFLAASYNQLTVDSFFYPAPNGNAVVSYTDIHPRSYFQPFSAYNPNGYTAQERTEREQEMLVRAVNAVSSQIPADLNIDGDDDGYVDNVCFIIQGQPDGWASLLWPHRWVLFHDFAYINNKRVWDFNFQLESFLNDSGAGVLSHEMFHSLSAPDLYRYYNRDITPVGKWDIMARDLDPPQHMGAWMKHKYGQWITNVPTITSSGTYTLHPLASSSTNNVYRIDSWRSNEYYLLEYRKPHGIYDENLPGTGLIVYRLDIREEGNANGPPDELYIYRPGGTNSVDGNPDLAALSAQNGHTEISEATAPNGFLGDGSSGGLNLFDVGVAGDTISFKVKISDIQLTYPHGGETWICGDNKVITWKSKSDTGTVTLEYSSDGGQNWNLIATGMGNTGSYVWNSVPPMDSSNQVHIRITNQATGQSDSNYYPFTVVGGNLPPPSNLTATVQEHNVSLSWQPPDTRNLLGYNIYRNSTLIATVTATEYLDENLSAGVYNYIVTASYTEGESAATNVATVFVESSLMPPTNLQATVGETDVNLTWNAPALPSDAFPENSGTWQLLGYKVYRNNLLIANTNQCYFFDGSLFFGSYSYTVTAEYFHGESEPAGPVEVVISYVPAPTNLTAEVMDNRVALSWSGPDEYSILEMTGYKVYRDDQHIATLNDADTLSYTDMGLANGTYTYGVTALYTHAESLPVSIEVTVEVTLGEVVFEEDFEEYVNFASLPCPWWLIDEDDAYTTSIPGISFPGAGDKMTYITFNPSATVPPIEELSCHSGNKMAASFAAVGVPNSDYMIAPHTKLGSNSKFRFFARSHSAEYGLERFKVGVSTRYVRPHHFNWIDANCIEVPASWTEYIYDLNDYNGEYVYIAIRCQSEGTMALYIDDVSIHSDGGYLVGNDDNSVPALSTRLEGNYPNPFNPSTTIHYSLKEAGPVRIEIFNLRGQMIRSLVNESKASGSHKVMWDGKDKRGNTMSSGIYFFRMEAGKHSETRKMIMMK